MKNFNTYILEKLHIDKNSIKYAYILVFDWTPPIKFMLCYSEDDVIVNIQKHNSFHVVYKTAHIDKFDAKKFSSSNYLEVLDKCEADDCTDDILKILRSMAKESKITEKLHISKNMNINDERRFIMKWTNLIEMHYADWVKEYESKLRYDLKKTTDEEIKKEMNELIKWLDDHYRSEELWYFERTELPFDFKSYLERNNYL